MEKIFNFFNIIGIDLKLLIVSLFGSLISVSNKKHLRDWRWRDFLKVFVGALAATWVTPLIYSIFNFENDKASFGIAFVIGYVGLKGTEMIVEKHFKPKSE